MKGGFAFLNNAVFCALWGFFGINPRHSCYAAYPNTTPIDINTWDKSEPYVNVTLWYDMLCWAAFIAYAFGTLCSFGYFFKSG